MVEKKLEIHMSREDHIWRHNELYKALNELLRDYINETGKDPKDICVLDLLAWSNSQRMNPEKGEI